MDLKLGQSVCNSSNQEISQFHDRLPSSSSSSSSSFPPFPSLLYNRLLRGPWHGEEERHFRVEEELALSLERSRPREKLKFFNPSLCLYSSLVSLSWPQVTCLLSSSRFYWLLFSFSEFYLRFYRFWKLGKFLDRILFVNENFVDLLSC